jgi:hypothetical protein
MTAENTIRAFDGVDASKKAISLLEDYRLGKPDAVTGVTSLAGFRDKIADIARYSLDLRVHQGWE